MTGKPDRPDTTAEETPGQGPAQAESRDADAAETIAELQRKADEHWDLYLRAAAEAENVRKRAARNVEQAHRYALESFSRELLAVRDSLEMGLAAADTADPAALLEGSEATLKQLTRVLEQFGIAEVDPAGEPFDPQYHEAMTMQPSEDVEPGSVLTVIQKGYTLNDRLLRPARVIVAAAPAAAVDDD